ncbi:hypothetical protein HOA87_03440 [bacterium]|jgi:hypothetical protein|nr:hypothetical protein [bacterium]MBT6777019.1 hypothetical protein [bacterium]|tara:strand:- start:1842 stop:2054 length:213 start_codon:yes stop_codon:yes gene_type:complete
MNNKKNDIHHQENIGNTRHLKMPERLWKLVTKAAKNNRSIHDYIITIIENDLIKRKMLKKAERKKFLSKR